jgi:hypothetical protein
MYLLRKLYTWPSAEINGRFGPRPVSRKMA